jgi:hypothetical protein
LANDCILASNGSVRMVIGFDLGYPTHRSKRGTLSVFVPEIATLQAEHDDVPRSVLRVKATVVDQVGPSLAAPSRNVASLADPCRAGIFDH